MSDEVRDLAIICALEKVLADRKAAIKASLPSTRTTLYANTIPGDPTSPELGKLVVPKPVQPAPKVFDEDQAVAWAVGEGGFGEEAMDVRPRLSDAGRKSVIAAAKRGVKVPGVELPEVRVGTPAFTPSKDVVDLVADMVRTGVLDVRTMLQIGGE